MWNDATSNHLIRYVVPFLLGGCGQRADQEGGGQSLGVAEPGSIALVRGRRSSGEKPSFIQSV